MNNPKESLALLKEQFRVRKPSDDGHEDVLLALQSALRGFGQFEEAERIMNKALET